METNAKTIAALLLTLGLAGTAAQAQHGPGPKDHGPDPRQGGPRDRGRAANGPRAGRGPRHDELIALSTLTGTVQQFSANDDGILDGLVLKSDSGAVNVGFPAHLGQQVMKAVKVGSRVSVTGFRDAYDRGGHFRTDRATNENQFKMTKLEAGITTVLDTRPTPPALPPASTTPNAETMTTVTGKVAAFRTDREGRTNALVLDDKTIVHLPPHASYQLSNLATKGTTITAQGVKKPLRDGQVQLEKITVLRASALTINGQQYLVR